MTRFVVAAILLALALASSAGAERNVGPDTLQLNAVFALSSSKVACPPGTPANDVCFKISGVATIPGLGHVTESHMVMTGDDSLSCVPLGFTPVAMSIAGKGEIDASIRVSASCNAVPTAFTITGGSGDFAGASGSGSFKAGITDVGDGDDPEIDEDDLTEGEWHQDFWTGTLTVPGHSFDLTPPEISGAVSKTVHAPSHAKRARVTYQLPTAVDNVDGAVPVNCTPRSGSLFRIGRTTVKCTATDSSANTATASFRVTVKHGR
jgi:hypothetical protein